MLMKYIKNHKTWLVWRREFITNLLDVRKNNVSDILKDFLCISPVIRDVKYVKITLKSVARMAAISVPLIQDLKG